METSLQYRVYSVSSQHTVYLYNTGPVTTLTANLSKLLNRIVGIVPCLKLDTMVTNEK